MKGFLFTLNLSLEARTMKKIVSILLVGVMLMSFMSVSAFAQTTINEELQTYLNTMDDDDLVWVWIWIRSKIDTEALEHQALVECGLLGENLDTQEEIDMYKSARWFHRFKQR